MEHDRTDLFEAALELAVLLLVRAGARFEPRLGLLELSGESAGRENQLLLATRDEQTSRSLTLQLDERESGTDPRTSSPAGR